MMRIRLFFLAALLMLLLVGMALTQDGADGLSMPAPTPTATWSPRAIEGIYQTLRVNYGLEIDNSSEFFPSHDEVSTFIQLFERQYLGWDSYMPYATRIFTGFMDYDQYHRTLYLLDEPLSKGLSEWLYSVDALPIASIGLRKDGFAMLYTPRCGGPDCDTPQEQMAHFQRNMIGVFVTYVPGTIESQDEALKLIYQTYPRLQKPGLGLIKGFTFGLKTIREIDGVKTPLMYYTGTVSLPRYTAVFAVVGVGEDKAHVITFNP